MEVSEGTEAGSMRFKGRKHVRYEDLWVRKIQKDSGKVYETYLGEIKAAKELGLISCACSQNCSKKLSLSEQQSIFGKFYELKSHDVQNQYLIGRSEVKRKRAKGPSGRSSEYSSL